MKAVLALAAIASVAHAGVETSYRAEVQAKHSDITSRVAGPIKRVVVRDRQLVQAGDALIELDDADLRVKVIAAEAEVAARRAELAVAQTKQVDPAQLRLAEARVDLAKSKLELAKLELAYATITADLAGTVTLRGQLPGALVQAQQTVATVTDLEHAWVDAYFQEPQVAHIAVGQLADIDVNGVALHGAVTEIDREGAAMAHAIADVNGSRVGVRVQIELRDKPAVWPGMVATARVHTP